MRDYLATCPESLKPKQDGHDWVYANGSRLVVIGTDAQTFRRGRGFSRVSLDVRDEYCFYQDLDAVESALDPGLQVPGPNGLSGRALRISTPAESSAHASKLLVDAAKAQGRYERVETLYDNPRVDPEVTIRRECQRLNLTREELLVSTAWKREYMGLWVTEESRAAVPAWTDENAEACTLPYPRPTHFDGYTSHDWGGYTGDPHAALFGFLDFKTAKLIIEDEDEVRGVDGEILCNRWKAKETALWGARSWDGTLFGAGFYERHTKELPDFLRKSVAEHGPRQPFVRLADHDEQLVGEMLQLRGYALLPAIKHDKHLAIDDLNVAIRARRIIIHPRCKRLLEQLRSTVWNEKRTEWVRTDKDHGDLIDCLLYMWRGVYWHHDPAPPAPPDYWGDRAASPNADLVRAMTGRRR